MPIFCDSTRRAGGIKDHSLCTGLVWVTNLSLSILLFFLSEKPNYFVKELSDLKVDESGTAVFTCQSERDASSVVWRKGMAELRAGRKYEITQKGQVLQLAIKNLEKSDSDTYTCDIGDAQSRAKLVVQGMHERNMTVHPVSPPGNTACRGRSIS